jgi:ankyrin repeat protein
LLTGEIELLRILLSKGVDVDSQSDAGTPLIWAAGHGQEDAVKVLLEHHASVSLHFFFVLVMSFICFQQMFVSVTHAFLLCSFGCKR